MTESSAIHGEVERVGRYPRLSLVGGAAALRHGRTAKKSSANAPPPFIAVQFPTLTALSTLTASISAYASSFVEQQPTPTRAEVLGSGDVDTYLGHEHIAATPVDNCIILGLRQNVQQKPRFRL